MGDPEAVRRAAIPGVERLRSSWRAADLPDLCARLGALQLLPKNTPFTARLGAAVNVASTISSMAGGRRRERLTWLNGETFGPALLGKLDDPYEEWVTDSVPFVGGPYTIFPGREAGRGSLLRALLLAVFFDGQSRELVARLKPTAWTALRLSDAVAARAGLRPGLADRAYERDYVDIPGRSTMAPYMRAVRWSDADLVALCDRQALNNLAPLTRSGPSRTSLQELLTDDEVVPPIWRRPGEHIVSHPLTLAAWLCRWLVEETVRAGHRGDLAEAFHRAVDLETEKAVEQLGWLRGKRTEVEKSAGVLYSEQFCLFDRGRTAHVLVVTDDFERWSWASQWPTDLTELMRRRARDARERLGSDVEILTLAVVQHAGRWAQVPAGPGALGPGHRYLGVTPEDLGVVARLDPDPMGVWKFCLAVEEVEGLVDLHALSSTAVYQSYRAGHASLELLAREAAARSTHPDERPIFLLRPGGAGELRGELSDRFDRHVEPWLLPNSFVDVWRRSDDPPAPLYVVEGAQRAARLWKGEVGSVWIVGPAGLTGEAAQVYEAFVDVISYWLWQLDPWSNEFLARSRRPLVLTIDVDEPGVFTRSAESVSLVQPVIYSITDNGVEIHIGATLMPLIEDRPDNGAERLMMRMVIEALAAAGGRRVARETLDRVMDSGMPRGSKRRFPLDPGDADIDPTGLPPLRSLQLFDQTLVARHAAEEVRRMGQSPGLIRGEDAVRLVNALVAKDFERLRTRVAELRSEGLLEILVTYNERFMMERALEGRTLRTEILCWSGEKRVLARLLRDSTKRGAGAAALRFLIEIASAVAPHGTRPFDLLAYDELLALSAQILEFGGTSDAIFSGLTTEGPVITESGLVLPSLTQNVSLQKDLLEAVARQSIAHAVESQEPAEASSPDMVPWGGIDEAFRSELGLSLNDLIYVVGDLYDLGERQQEAAKVVDLSAAIDRIATIRRWTPHDAERALAFWTLTPRDDFLRPPPPYTLHDVYPWRHNRGLSYLRRPLLQRQVGSRYELVYGLRQLRASALYVAELVRRGRLRRTPGGAIDRALGRLRNAATLRFNDRVAGLLTPPRFRVRSRLGTLAGRRMKDHIGDLGDIDVLAADLQARRLYAIETKDLGGARTPYEIAHEIGALTGRPLSEGVTSRQARRAAWCAAHLAELVQLLDLSPEPGWRTEWLFVSDTPLALASRERRLVTLDELAARIAEHSLDLCQI